MICLIIYRSNLVILSFKYYRKYIEEVDKLWNWQFLGRNHLAIALGYKNKRDNDSPWYL